jgi:lipopolysaccharide biosynthesis glycosyltransferase
VYHIAYCFDRNFNQHFASAITSAILNFRKPQHELHFHIVTDNVDETLRDFLDDTKSIFGCNISEYVLTEEKVQEINRIPESLRNMFHFTVAAYFRLLLPSLVPDSVDRLLYLDCDTIVIDDLTELIDSNLDGNAAGLVLDPKTEVFSKYYSIDKYFNSGVLLFDLVKWRDQALAEKCFSYFENPRAPVRNADQCAINVVLEGNIQELEPRWNIFTSNVTTSVESLFEVRKNCSILHFFSKEKPWKAWYKNDLGQFYWVYLNASPWKNAQKDRPVTVLENLAFAQKLEQDGQFSKSIEIYRMVANHFLKKT